MQPDMVTALNEHLVLEYGAWHKYLSMSLWAEMNDLPGFAAWLKKQADDELTHAQRIVDHLVERDQQAIIPPISSERNWKSPTEVVEQVLAGEQKVTASIHALYDRAEKANDRAAMIMLQWFINEQVEEENAARAILGRLRLAGDAGVGLMLVDQELGQGQLAAENGGN